MLGLATKGLDSLEINPIEIHRTGPTYTIDTLEALEPKNEYFWILGTDQLANFCTWHKWQDIALCVGLVVAQRPGSTLTPPLALSQWLNAHQRTLLVIPFEPLDVSATAIRQRLAQQQSARDLLPEVVEQYIHEHGLYRPLTA
jgi:nicotinate-nucleotide adenylyltransferase